MFERFTDQARRAIFYARYEASGFGGRFIETQHLLLGILRAAPELATTFLGEAEAEEAFRAEFVELAERASRVSTSVDMPLSRGCQRALAYAAEEAERARIREIRPGHLLLGLLREEEGAAWEALTRRGLTAPICRDRLLRFRTLRQPEEGAPFLPELTEQAVRDALRGALQGDLAHVDSATVFDGLSFELADKRVGSAHTVFEILQHIVYWQEKCLDYLGQARTDWAERAEESWAAGAAPADEPEWQRAVERYKRTLRALLEQLGRCDLAFAAASVTNMQALQATAQHTSYHLGQAVVVRQLLGAWPPPGGGLG
jgi:uncharacterized damage-inducible protein DinB